MSITSEDLEDYEEKFRNMFFKHNDKQANADGMCSLLENLSKELELSRKHENTLQENLKLCLQNDDFDITTKYVTLKEKCDNYEKENENLKHQLNSLQVQLETDKETERQQYLNKNSELEEKYKREIINLRNQIESDKICYETKEKELYNELQLAQASTALQCDEIESNFKKQLVDVNYKLRQSQNIIRSLQTETNSLRIQLAASQQYTTSYQKTERPVLKYQPLPLTKNSKISEDTEDAEFFEAPIAHSSHITTLIFKGTNLPKPKEKHNIPPLKQCSDVNPEKSKTIKRKRKLYNPENTEYLEELEKST